MGTTSPALATLKKGDEEHCTLPNHPSAHGREWDARREAKRDLEDLERLARGAPIEPRERAPDPHGP